MFGEKKIGMGKLAVSVGWFFHWEYKSQKTGRVRNSPNTSHDATFFKTPHFFRENGALTFTHVFDTYPPP